MSYPPFDWKQRFKDLCEQMKRDSLEHAVLGDRGVIDLLTKEACKSCSSVGVYFGNEMEQGLIYETANARYCPSCAGLSDIVEGVNFAPWNQTRFLPVLKKKLIEDPALRDKVQKSSPCESCHGDTYTFTKDLGGVDCYDNEWTVCVNPACSWPGSHYESYTSWGSF